MTAAERRLDREILFSGASLALTFVATIVYPPLRLIALPSIVYSLAPIYRDAYVSARAGNLDVNVLYAATQTIVMARGYLLMAGLGAFYYFLSHKMLVMAEDRFRMQLHGIFGQLPTTVYKVVDGVEVESPLSALVAGDCVAARAGSVIPVDGIVVAGSAIVDQQSLTGESQPVEKSVGDKVYAATLIIAGNVQIESLETGEATVVARIGEILEYAAESGDHRLNAARLADRMVPPVVVLSALSIPFLGPDGALAVIDSHPQRRMSISSALCTLNTLGMSAEEKLLVKDGRALERLKRIDTVIFDKTGTLTLDKPHVARIHPVNGYEADAVVRFAAAAEAHQEHPIAQAILHAATQRNLLVPASEETRYHLGYGLTVAVDGASVYVGSPRFLKGEGIDVPNAVQQQVDDIWRQGHSAVLVAVNGEVAGTIELHSTVRPEAAAIMQELKDRGLSVSIISGDHEAPTRRLATLLGVEQIAAEVLPEAKAGLVARLQDGGHTVCFIGDGINDAIAMQQADVSISLRGATATATRTADIVLMGRGLHQLPALLALTERYDDHLRATAGSILVGTVCGASGALFLGFGLWHVMVINSIVFPISLGLAMRTQSSSRTERRHGDYSDG